MTTATLTRTPVSFNTTCANFKNSTCQCGLQTKLGCAVECIGYTPNRKTRVKLHLGSWKYSYSWLSLGCTLSLALLFIKGF